MEFENTTQDSFQATQSTQEHTRPAYLRSTEYVHLFDAANDHREMFRPIIKGQQFREAQAIRKQFWTAVQAQLTETVGREFKIDTIQNRIREEINTRLRHQEQDIVDSNTENYAITMQESQPYINAMDLFIVTWRDVHEREANARKDAAELAEAQEQAVSKRATAYGSLFDSRKLTLTKKVRALKLKDRMKMPLDRKRALVKKKAELLDMYEEAEGVLEMDMNELLELEAELQRQADEAGRDLNIVESTDEEKSVIRSGTSTPRSRTASRTPSTRRPTQNPHIRSADDEDERNTRMEGYVGSMAAAVTKLAESEGIEAGRVQQLEGQVAQIIAEQRRQGEKQDKLYELIEKMAAGDQARNESS
jgi:hypothetical protein